MWSDPGYLWRLCTTVTIRVSRELKTLDLKVYGGVLVLLIGIQKDIDFCVGFGSRFWVCGFDLGGCMGLPWICMGAGAMGK